MTSPPDSSKARPLQGRGENQGKRRVTSPRTVVNDDAIVALRDERKEGCALAIVSESGSIDLGRRLSLEIFSDHRYQRIAQAMLAVISQGKPPIPAHVIAELRKSECLEMAGGLAFVSGLADDPPPACAFDSLLTDLQELAFRRGCLAEIDGLRCGLSDPTKNPYRLASLIGNNLVELGRPSNDGLPAFDDAFTLTEQSMPTPPAIVEGLVRRAEKCVLGGASKSFKSWAAIDLGLSVSHGVPWLGRAVVPGNVLFVNLELPLWSLRKRILDIANARSVRLEVGKLQLWTLRGQQVTAEQLLRTITERKLTDLALIIIDPAYKLLAGRDENAAGDIGSLMNIFERLASQTGAAVVIPAHFAKGNASGKESMDRISGSGVFARDPDSILTLTRHQEENAFTVEATLRTFPPVAPFVVKWCHPVFTVESALDPEKLKPARRPGPAKKHSPEDALCLLPEAGLRLAQWCKVCSDKRGISRSRFYDLARELEASGQVCTGSDEIVRPSQDTKGAPYADK